MNKKPKYTCWHCGTKHWDDDNYCEECGRKQRELSIWEKYFFSRFRRYVHRKLIKYFLKIDARLQGKTTEQGSVKR